MTTSKNTNRYIRDSRESIKKEARRLEKFLWEAVKRAGLEKIRIENLVRSSNEGVSAYQSASWQEGAAAFCREMILFALDDQVSSENAWPLLCKGNRVVGMLEAGIDVGRYQEGSLAK